MALVGRSGHSLRSAVLSDNGSYRNMEGSVVSVDDYLGECACGNPLVQDGEGNVVCAGCGAPPEQCDPYPCGGGEEYEGAS